MKKFAALFLALCLLLAGCGAGVSNNAPKEKDPEGVFVNTTVGILLPGNRSSLWEERCRELTEAVEALGYDVAAFYADSDPQLQGDQLEKLVLRGVDCLVVAAVDSLTLTDAIAYAKRANVPVVAYDRLLMNTDGVDWHIAFDSLAAGTAIGNHIVEEKQLASAAQESRTYTIEFFMGSPEDSNGQLIHSGIMAVLQPYLDAGTLVCSSGRVAFEDTCIQGWTGENAWRHYREHCASLYTQKAPDILCCASDSIAGGLCSAMENEGCHLENWPLITGQGGGEEALLRIAEGRQSMTLAADHAALATQCARGVHALLTGETPQTTPHTCNNGVVPVPAYLLPMFAE